MKALVAALLLITSPAMAKTWVDEACQVSLVSNDSGFAYRVGEKAENCTIESWPIARTEAALTCDSGAMATLSVIDDTAVLFNGQRLNAYDGELPCGKNGAEWPD